MTKEGRMKNNSPWPLILFGVFLPISIAVMIGIVVSILLDYSTLFETAGWWGLLVLVWLIGFPLLVFRGPLAEWLRERMWDFQYWRSERRR